MIRIAIIAGLLTGCGSSGADRVLDELENAEKVTLYSIDGRDSNIDNKPEVLPDEKLRGFPVFGKIEITEPAERKRIYTAIKEGLAAAKGKNELAKCFWPRHAIRLVVNGRTVDHVICFKCWRLRRFGDGNQPDRDIPIDEDARTALNEQLNAADIFVLPKL